MMLFAAAILCLHQNVFAAEGATVTVNGDTLQAGSDAWKVTLDISGDTKITNGKIRVTYDSSQLKLVSTGSRLHDEWRSDRHQRSGQRQ